ncbi:MAG: lysophospholipid acyltransferase family protein [Chloroflexota bacterium]
MNQLRALVRLVFIVSVVLFGMLVIFLFGWLPIRIPSRREEGVRLPVSIIRLMIHIFSWVFNVKFSCTDSEKLAQHQGFLFPNHVSFLDILIILAETPARFLSAIEVRQRFGLGWLTATADTIYVTRDNTESRLQVRKAVAEAFYSTPHLPIVLYPEGKLGPGDRLLPFRHGAFEIAAQNSIPYLPCAIRYSQPELVVWHGGRGESLTSAVWRFAQFPGPLYAEFIPLETVYPTPDDEPAVLAKEAQHDITVAMGFPIDQTEVLNTVT